MDDRTQRIIAAETAFLRQQLRNLSEAFGVELEAAHLSLDAIEQCAVPWDTEKGGP